MGENLLWRHGLVQVGICKGDYIGNDSGGALIVQPPRSLGPCAHLPIMAAPPPLSCLCRPSPWVLWSPPPAPWPGTVIIVTTWSRVSLRSPSLPQLFPFTGTPPLLLPVSYRDGRGPPPRPWPGLIAVLMLRLGGGSHYARKLNHPIFELVVMKNNEVALFALKGMLRDEFGSKDITHHKKF